ncbi:hypothetical protein REPUB_Repub16aG0023500 [Reevesia pubescens]
MISSAKVLRLTIILDLLVSDNSPAANAQLGVTGYAESPMRTLRTKEKHGGPDSGYGSPQAHSYLFGSDFVSVDALGKVLIISVPSLYFEDVMHSKHVSLSAKELQSSLKQDINHLKTSDGIMQTEAVSNITAYQTKSIKVDTVSTPQFCETDFLKEKMVDGVENLYTEAEISSEEEADDNESYDDSFIDDRINPTAGSAQTESGRVDMMAIYSPDCVASTSKDNGSGCSSGKTLPSLQIPQPESENQAAMKNARSFQIEERISSVSMPCRTNDFAIENESMQCRKRKLSFFQLESIPAINLEQQFSFQSEVGGKESTQLLPQVDKITANDNKIDDDDDQFYASLDLDAVEAEATLLLKNKSESSLEKQEVIAELNIQNSGLQGSPSFDLGIW